MIEENVSGALQKVAETREIGNGRMMEGMTLGKNPDVVAVFCEDVEHAENVVTDGVGSREAWG